MIERLRQFKPAEWMLHPFDPFVKLFLPIIPMWVEPNYLTVIRILGTPYVAYLLWTEKYVIGFIWFAVMALTDMFDGSIARLRDKITKVGIVMDPIADKLLIGTAAAILLFKVDPLLAVVLIGLEFVFLLGGVIKAATNHAAKELEANIYGKFKMTMQVLGLGFVFIALMSGVGGFLVVGQVFLWIAAVFATVNLFVFSL